MNTPQCENGYVKIANELFIALYKTRLSGEARQVLDFIIYKTYGFNKKQDWIANKQFCENLGMDKSNVVRAIKKLIAMKMVVKNDNKNTNIYSINKKIWEWEKLSKTTTSCLKRQQSCQNGQQELSKTPPTKDNITKDNKKDTKVSKNKIDFSILGLSDNYIEIWKEHRKSLRKPITQHVVKLFNKNLDDCFREGYSKEDAIDSMVSKGWITVEPEYLKNIKIKNTKKQPGYKFLN